MFAFSIEYTQFPSLPSSSTTLSTPGMCDTRVIACAAAPACVAPADEYDSGLFRERPATPPSCSTSERKCPSRPCKPRAPHATDHYTATGDYNTAATATAAATAATAATTATATTPATAATSATTPATDTPPAGRDWWQFVRKAQVARETVDNYYTGLSDEAARLLEAHPPAAHGISAILETIGTDPFAKDFVNFARMEPCFVTAVQEMTTASSPRAHNAMATVHHAMRLWIRDYMLLLHTEARHCFDTLKPPHARHAAGYADGRVLTFLRTFPKVGAWWHVFEGAGCQKIPRASVGSKTGSEEEEQEENEARCSAEEYDELVAMHRYDTRIGQVGVLEVHLEQQTAPRDDPLLFRDPPGTPPPSSAASERKCPPRPRKKPCGTGYYPDH